MFLLRRANPSAYVGLWQSRMSAPHIVREAGDLSLPILIDMQSGSLQHLVDLGRSLFCRNLPHKKA